MIWRPGSYRADAVTAMRRWWCPVCRNGVRLAHWVGDAYCGVAKDGEGDPDVLFGTGLHPLVAMRCLDLDHAADPTEPPRL